MRRIRLSTRPMIREEGRSPSELAREFEPSAQSRMNWVAQAEIESPWLSRRFLRSSPCGCRKLGRGR